MRSKRSLNILNDLRIFLNRFRDILMIDQFNDIWIYNATDFILINNNLLLNQSLVIISFPFL